MNSLDLVLFSWSFLMWIVLRSSLIGKNKFGVVGKGLVKKRIVACHFQNYPLWLPCRGDQLGKTV